MSRKLALVQWSKTLAVLLIIAGLQILLLDVALFIAYLYLTICRYFSGIIIQA